MDELHGTHNRNGDLKYGDGEGKEAKNLKERSLGRPTINWGP
jgi:hypothetical protein